MRDMLIFPAELELAAAFEVLASVAVVYRPFGLFDQLYYLEFSYPVDPFDP